MPRGIPDRVVGRQFLSPALDAADFLQCDWVSSSLISRSNTTTSVDSTSLACPPGRGDLTLREVFLYWLAFRFVAIVRVATLLLIIRKKTKVMIIRLPIHSSARSIERAADAPACETDVQNSQIQLRRVA